MSLHIGAAKGQIAPTVLMPGDPLRAKYIAENFLENAQCYSTVRNMFGFTGTYKGMPVSVQGSGMGMPSMGIYSWELMKDYDCRNIIRIGTAGSFSDKLEVRDLVAAMSASTDSNYAHAFKIPGNISACASYELLIKMHEASDELGLKVHGGNIISGDVFYELQEDWWRPWADMGVLAVEMEAAALYLNAAYNNVNALAIMTISNSFITGEEATVEERETSFTHMMELGLKTALKCE